MGALNDGLRFLLEVAALVAVARWGVEAFDGAAAVLAAVAAPLAAAAAWGTFVAPNAPRRQEDPVRLALELTLFGSAVAALAASGAGTAALVLGAAVAVHLAVTFPLGQR